MQPIEKARHIFQLMCQGFIAHDNQKLDLCAQLFSEAYRLIFSDIESNKTLEAGKAYATALAIKDSIDKEQDRNIRLVDPRWSNVYQYFLTIADLLNIDRRWAYHYNEFWRKHKGELEYWSDGIEAERIWSARLAPNWQNKCSDGRNGPGPLAFLYMAAVEAHDLHTQSAWRTAEEVMTIYFISVFESD